MVDEQLWHSGQDDEESGRALELGARAMARVDARPRAPSDSLSTARTTALETRAARLIVGSQGVVARGEASCEVVGPLGTRRGTLDASGFCLDRSGAHLLATRRPRHSEDAAELQSRRMPGLGVVGHLPIDKPQDVVEIQRFDALYLVCSEHPRPPHTTWPPETEVLLMHVPSLATPGFRGRIVNADGLAIATCFDAGRLCVSVGERGIVLATTRGVQWTDWALRPTTCWPAECYPHALAIGESGETALVCDIHRAESLVAFGADGTKRFRVPVPESEGAYHHHVVIDDDGTIILSPPGWMIAFDRNGSRRWVLQRSGTTPAVLLADGHVMFEHASGLWVADRNGRAREVWRGSVPLTAGPVEHDGHWFVASADTLFELR